MDHPRLCPRPVVCLHHGSAKRGGKTEEPGEAWAGGGAVEMKGGKRMKSGRLHFVTEVQNFRG